MSETNETVASLIVNPEHKAAPFEYENRVTNPPEKIFIVDYDYFCREGISSILGDHGWLAEAFSSCEEFLLAHDPQPNTCLLLDIHFPGMDGLELLNRLGGASNSPPIIVVSGSSGIAEAVESMKHGALDFIEKPVRSEVLIASVRRALSRSRCAGRLSKSHDALVGRLDGLTPRQHQILDLVLAGQPSKNIAADLGISRRTVENHRASIMRRMGARSLAALVRMVMSRRAEFDT
jgi:two-component system CheB/CheR fusion protein